MDNEKKSTSISDYFITKTKLQTQAYQQSELTTQEVETLDELISTLKQEDFTEIETNSKPINEAYKENHIFDYYIITDILLNNDNKKIFNCKKRTNIFNNNTDIIQVCLYGIWAQTLLSKGATIFLSAFYNKEENCYRLDSSIKDLNPNNIMLEILNNLIIYEPESLFSPSQIKSGFVCYRAPVIIEEIKLSNYNEVSKATLIGEILHELFEKIILIMYTGKIRTLTSKGIEDYLKEVMVHYAFKISKLSETFESIFECCKEYLTNIFDFCAQYIRNKNPIDNGIKINKFHSSEQYFQSSLLGMKGIIDVLVDLKKNNDPNVIVAPLELKSGKQLLELDSIQVLIYCLILSEQFGKNSSDALLFYFKNGKCFNIKVRFYEMVNVIVLRNNVAYNIKNYEENENFESCSIINERKGNNSCNKCFKREICFSHFSLIENIKDIENLGDEFNEIKKSYSFDIKIKNYFKQYYSLINKEQKFYNNECNKRLGNVNISEYTKIAIENIIDKVHSFILEVKVINESKDNNNYGNIFKIYTSKVEEFAVYFSKQKTIVIGSLLHKDSNKNTLKINCLKFNLSKIIYDYLSNISKSQSFSLNDNDVYIKNTEIKSKFTFKLSRGNLIRLCSNFEHSDIIKNLQELLIYDKVPTYNCSYKTSYDIMKFIKDNFNNEFIALNNNQKHALIQSIICNNYSLIKGFPGSGKTTLIALLTRILSSMGKKILITTNSNIALDNILLKLNKAKISFCRIAPSTLKVHKDIQPFILSEESFTTVDEWNSFYNNQNIFASTIASLSNFALVNMIFDYCIVDEACQIFEPSLLGPLIISKRFILVGDPNQLSALLRSVKIENIPPSLMSRLATKHPNSCVELVMQYRMNEDILKLSNECVYNNIMQCGNNTIAKNTLQIDMNKINSISNKKYITDILNPYKPVVLVDYKEVISNEEIETIEDLNPIESKIIESIIDVLYKAKFELKSMGIITPYLSQEKYIYQQLKKFSFENIYTIDKSQGMEKDIIIISFVKTNNKTKILNDIARINVAFTRPKTKLIIIALKDILNTLPQIKIYLNILIKHNWIYSLSKNDL